MTNPIRVRRVRPEFPHYDSKNGIRGVLSFLASTLLWFLLIVVFVFAVYTNWFCRNATALFMRFFAHTVSIPFWVGALVVVFLFPFTLVVIGLNHLLKHYRGY
jgi:hypothetical protein